MGITESAAARATSSDPTSLESWLALGVPDRLLAANARTERARSDAGESGAWISVQQPAPQEKVDGPLAGIPYSVKDNIDAAPFATMAGSPLLPRTPVTDEAGGPPLSR